MCEANLKLTEGLKKNDLVQVDVAKSLVVAAQNLRSEEQEYRTQKTAIMRQVNKRKSDLLQKKSKSKPPKKQKRKQDD